MVKRLLALTLCAPLGGLASAQVHLKTIDLPSDWQMVEEKGALWAAPVGLKGADAYSVTLLDRAFAGKDTASHARKLLAERGYRAGRMEAFNNRYGLPFVKAIGSAPDGRTALVLAAQPGVGVNTVLIEGKSPKAFGEALSKVGRLGAEFIRDSKGSDSGTWVSPDGRSRATGSASATGDTKNAQVTGSAGNGWAQVNSSSSSSSSQSNSDRQQSSNSQSNSDRDSHSSRDSQQKSDSQSNGMSDSDSSSNKDSDNATMTDVAYDSQTDGFKVIRPASPANVNGRFNFNSDLVRLPGMAKDAKGAVLEVKDGSFTLKQILPKGQTAVRSGKLALSGGRLCLITSDGKQAPLPVSRAEDGSLSVSGILFRPAK